MPLTIWLLKDGELLPIQGSRKMRTSMLADALVARGHHVTWWASTFSHQRKQLLASTDREVRAIDGMTLRLLHAGGYRRNVSLARYRHHWRLGRRFAAVAPLMAAPDVIVAAYPVIDLAAAAVRFGRERRIPVIVDVRDLWPDTYLDQMPGALRGVARMALARDFQHSRFTLGAADSLVSMSEGVLSWAQARGNRRSTLDRVFPIGRSARMGARPARPDYLADAGTMVVAYVGTFGQTANLRAVTDAAHRLASAGVTDVQFVIAGDGDQRAAISAAVRGLPNVTLPGWLDEAAGDALLAHADVALLPWCGPDGAMPNKLFDYLAAGRPVISSATGELATLLDRAGAGWHYGADDAAALADVVTSLAGDRSRVASAARAATALFELRFTSNTIYPAYAAHVESVARRAERPAA
jgi:glycosyltransferase involved in cell wall biosynthesis